MIEGQTLCYRLQSIARLKNRLTEERSLVLVVQPTPVVDSRTAEEENTSELPYFGPTYLPLGACHLRRFYVTVGYSPARHPVNL